MVVAPAIGLAVPAGHGAQAKEPGADEYVPAGQLVQKDTDVAPGSGL